MKITSLKCFNPDKTHSANLLICFYKNLNLFNCVVPENNHTHPKEGHWKFQGGGGISKAKIFKGKYEAELEIPEWWQVGGSNQKTFRGGMDIFRIQPHKLVQEFYTFLLTVNL